MYPDIASLHLHRLSHRWGEVVPHHSRYRRWHRWHRLCSPGVHSINRATSEHAVCCHFCRVTQDTNRLRDADAGWGAEQV